jgi:hypothetical protein
MVHGEDHGFALDEGHDSARDCMRGRVREHKLTPGETSPGRERSSVTWRGKTRSP